MNSSPATVFTKIDDYRFEIPRRGDMRVPGRIIATERLLKKIGEERVAQQIANVACLPGIVGWSLAMPDAHWGYGFPVGGVAATDIDAGGVISPGGIGFDISCGVRLLRTNLEAGPLKARVPELMDALFAAVPSGVGSEGRIRLDARGMKGVFEGGARWAASAGFGDEEDLRTCEDGGRLSGADPELPSEKAVARGKDQLGTLGSGNHFLEVQEIDEIYDAKAAAAFGLFKGQLVASVHTGSRGCGYQICEDSLRAMRKASQRHRISVPDPQLACAPFSSDEGKEYFAAMCSAANFARANRQVITHRVREAFERGLGISPKDHGVRVVYDVCHNIAKVETHEVGGRKVKVCVHRKGATRAFPAGHPEVPEPYRAVGQPVLVPGSMGTFTYVLAGTQEAMSETFGTTCHGAGRMMSRTQAAKQVHGGDLARDLKSQGIEVRTDSYRGLAEEAPFAYKDVSEVVEACHGSGISRKVARMRPLGVVKG
ncbi:MAG: RtcB family protein [Elusimicrobia bacterium]|nr:RtcB family protein [Elusimicrobiota bacterium]